MTPELHPAAATYVERLQRAARRLPGDARDDLVADIVAHLHEAIAADASEAQVLTVLDRLGPPEEIVAAQSGGAAERAPDPRGRREWATIILLLAGGWLLGVGWLVGLVLLWNSRAWSRVDKLIGTLVVPGGLAAVPVVLLLAASKETCVSGPGPGRYCSGGPSTAHHILAIILLVISLVGPITTAFYLARRARMPSARPVADVYGLPA